MSIYSRIRQNSRGRIVTYAGIAVFVAGFAQVAQAGAIYRCQLDSGVVEYSNSATGGASKNCQKIALPAITTVPANAPAVKSRKPGKTAKSKGSSEGAIAKRNAKQSQRDKDRARILRDELKKEEARLADLRQNFKNGEPDRRGDERNYQKYLVRVETMKAEIARREGNLKALRQELAALKP